VCPLRRQSIIYVSIYKKKVTDLNAKKECFALQFFIIENDSLLGYILLTSYKLQNVIDVTLNKVHIFPRCFYVGVPVC
jgi:hypothetical protein